MPAITTFWSSTCLVCILPPSCIPGAVPVSFQQTNSNIVFVYRDDSERALLELALQVIGIKLTGKLTDARQIAMNIVNSRENNPISSIASNYNQNVFAGKQQLETLIINALLYLHSISGPFNFRHPDTFYTLLSLSIASDMTNLSQFLIDCGYSIDYLDKNGYSALMHCGLYNRVKTGALLVSKGAIQTFKNINGNTAFEIATEYGHVEFNKTLKSATQDWFRIPWTVKKTRKQEFKEFIDRIRPSNSGSVVLSENIEGNLSFGLRRFLFGVFVLMVLHFFVERFELSEYILTGMRYYVAVR